MPIPQRHKEAERCHPQTPNGMLEGRGAGQPHRRSGGRQQRSESCAERSAPRTARLIARKSAIAMRSPRSASHRAQDAGRRPAPMPLRWRAPTILARRTGECEQKDEHRVEVEATQQGAWHRREPAVRQLNNRHCPLPSCASSSRRRLTPPPQRPPNPDRPCRRWPPMRQSPCPRS